jgi:predicted RNA-binding Zn-ribbon protein involved in translation (DUF1610 family)
MKRIEPRGTVIKCEKCGGRIKPGEEIKIGGIRKKYFHLKCYEQVEKVRMATYTHDNTGASVKNLVKSGQTLTYYCPHCGAPLKIEAKSPQIQKFCIRCRGDLGVLDMGKLLRTLEGKSK